MGKSVQKIFEFMNRILEFKEENFKQDLAFIQTAIKEIKVRYFEDDEGFIQKIACNKI